MTKDRKNETKIDKNVSKIAKNRINKEKLIEFRLTLKEYNNLSEHLNEFEGRNFSQRMRNYLHELEVI